MLLTGNLQADKALFTKALENDSTVVFRELSNKDGTLSACIIYTEVLVNNLIIDQNIVRPLIACRVTGKDPADTVAKSVIHADEVKTKTDFDALIKNILIGDTVVLIDGSKSAVAVNSKKYNTRGVPTSETETTVYGPKESFNELIVSNIGLIRRKIKNPKLKFRIIEVGKVSKTRVCISYIEGIAEEKLVNEVRTRLEGFEIDAPLDSAYIAELIRDKPYSPAKTLGTTERPDVVAAKLLEGRVAIITDGSPDVITLPFLFVENFQASEDYYTDFYFASFNRGLRFLAFLIATFLPAIYISLICYHKEMLPSKLLVSIVSSRNEVPFPAIVEMFILLFLFDLIREAGVRLPKPVGSTMSTVGAIVLGQSIVSAKIVSAEMIIIVAMCGICGFLTPKLEGEIIAVRIITMIFASVIGIYGVAFSILIILIHLSKLKSFGREYLAYLTPHAKQSAKDIFVRSSFREMFKRPFALQRINKRRLKR